MKHLLLILLLVPACCATRPTRPDPPVCKHGIMLAGTYTEADATLLAHVLQAFDAVGKTPPVCHTLTFVYDESTAQKVLPTSTHPGVWKYFRGFCRNETRAIYIRRFGPDLVDDYTYSLVIHEIAHAVGYTHGPDMEAFLGEVRAKYLEMYGN